MLEEPASKPGTTAPDYGGVPLSGLPTHLIHKQAPDASVTTNATQTPRSAKVAWA